MKILHLTDLHFSNTGAKRVNAQETLTENLCRILEPIEIDLIIFSGDLVNIGEHHRWFELCNEGFIAPILKATRLDLSKIIFCQGNHDVDRSKIREALINYVDSIKSNESLNTFCNFSNRDFTDILEASNNYNQFIKSLGQESLIVHNGMYSNQIIKVKNYQIGITSINTSWRSTGDDRNKLLYPTELIEEAYQEIKSVDKKILVHHHPISDLKEFNKYQVEDIIHKYYDISFFGHIHKGLTTIDYTPNTGIIKIMSPASLKFHQGGEIGFSILDFNFDESIFEVETYLYSDQYDTFYQLTTPKKYQIPQSEELQKQNDFRKTIRKIQDKENILASELLVSLGDNEENNFMEMYVDPVLIRSDFDRKSVDSQKTYTLNDVLENVDKDYYLITGNDKCGKSSLSKRFLIEILLNYELNDSLPYLLDFNSINPEFDFKKFERRLRTYYEVNSNRLRELLNERTLILIVDNYDPKQHWQISLIDDIFNSFDNVSFIGCSKKTADIELNKTLIGNKEPIVLEFADLRKKQIRVLTSKWSLADNHQKEEIVTKIDSMFRQLSIPFNFWTVSLFLWVFKRGGEKSIQNNVGLVELYIESLLERENLIKSNSNFAYEKYIDLMAYIAKFLLTEHSCTIYSATELELLNFIDNYLKSNPRNKNVNPHEVWNYLVERGIFKNIDKERFTFRLNGVFEFFLATYMKLDNKFRDQVLEDDNVYLSFKNEFELYAGFTRNDEEFLDKIYEKSKKIFESLDLKYSNGTIDEVLKDKTAIAINYDLHLKKLSDNSKSLTIEEKEKLEDIEDEKNGKIEEGVKKKSPKQIDVSDIGNLEESLFILGRVFRNMDGIRSEKKVQEIFKYYLKIVCKWGFHLMDFSQQVDLLEIQKETGLDVKTFFEWLSKVTPCIVQKTASEHINQKNLDGIIEERIQKIVSDPESPNNQYELYILTFLLIDIDLRRNLHLIESHIDYLKIPVLKFSALLKLYEYFFLKTNEDKELEKELKALIQKVTLSLDNSASLGGLHKSFEEKKKNKRLKN